MADFLTIREVSQISGLATHTIRYYEKQFPSLLSVKRSKGGHRLYDQHLIRNLEKIKYLLKEQRMTIRQAQKKLGESSYSSLADENDTNSSCSNDVAQLLTQILDKLDTICKNNEKRDKILESLLQKNIGNSESELLEQISKCREETQKTAHIYRAMFHRKINSN